MESWEDDNDYPILHRSDIHIDHEKMAALMESKLKPTSYFSYSTNCYMLNNSEACYSLSTVSNIENIQRLVNKCMHTMKLTPFGENNYYDKNSRVSLEGCPFESWPIFSLSVKELDGKNLALCVNFSYATIAIDSVNLMITKMDECNTSTGDSKSLSSVVNNYFVGSSILSSHDHKTYLVEFVDFAKSPLSAFDSNLTYKEYYAKEYSANIMDLSQPILRCVNNDDMTAQPEYLIPELCNIVRNTENIRFEKDFGTKLHQLLYPSPSHFTLEVDKFITRLKSNIMVKKQLLLHGLHLAESPMVVSAHNWPIQSVYFKHYTEHKIDESGDFSVANATNEMIMTKSLLKWAIVGAENFAPQITLLAEQLIYIGLGMGMIIKKPKLSFIAACDLPSYIQAVRQFVGVQLIFVVMRSSSSKLYWEVQRELTSNLGILSYFFDSGLFINPTCGIDTMASKIVLQLNVRIGGIPWSLDYIQPNLMVIGVDSWVNHDDELILATVCSTNRQLWKYSNTTCRLPSKSENIWKYIKNEIWNCMRAYRSENGGQFPKNIILYRGKYKATYQKYEDEIFEIQSAFTHLSTKMRPKLAFIVVDDARNERLLARSQMSFSSPPIGTTVENFAGLGKGYHNFLLISEADNGGLRKPTSYSVLCNENNSLEAFLQCFTNKLCNLNFTSPSSGNVPAILSYARKLAKYTAFVSPINSKLTQTLYFL